MTTRISNAARSASTDAVVDLIDLGGAGSIEIRTGSQPAGPGSAASGTLLATIELAATAYGDASNGTAELTSPPRSGGAVAGGDAGWFRILNGSGVAVLDGSITGPGGGGDLILDNVSLANGQTVSITALPYTQPAG